MSCIPVNHGCISVNHGCFLFTYHHPSCLVHLVGVGYISFIHSFIQRVPQKVEDISYVVGRGKWGLPKYQLENWVPALLASSTLKTKGACPPHGNGTTPSTCKHIQRRVERIRTRLLTTTNNTKKERGGGGSKGKRKTTQCLSNVYPFSQGFM